MLLLAMPVHGQQQRCRPLPTLAQTQPAQLPTFKVTGAQWRSDLCRIALDMKGRPHTSGRIDSVTLVIGKRRYEATDIDGVDMKRYFQFEEDGLIPLEVDFPAVPRRPLHYQLIFHTVHGDVTVNA